MPQIVPISTRRNAALLGLAKSLAHGMEIGARPMQRGVETDDGRIIFQKLGYGVVRALVDPWPIVVGYVMDNTRRSFSAVAWINGVRRDLGRTPESPYSHALAISRDGGTIVGYANDGSDYYDRPCVWRGTKSPLVWLDVPKEMQRRGGAACQVSADGRVITGYRRHRLRNGSPFGYDACIWVGEVFTLIDIGHLRESDLPFHSFATACSADGRVVAGYGEYEFVNGFSWVFRDGVVSMLPTPADIVGQYVSAISNDGRVILGKGYRMSPQDDSPFALTAHLWVDGLYQELKGLPDAASGKEPYFLSLSLSADGRTVVAVWADQSAAGTEFAFMLWRDGILEYSAPVEGGYTLAAANVLVNGRLYGCVRIINQSTDTSHACTWPILTAANGKLSIGPVKLLDDVDGTGMRVYGAATGAA